MTGNPISKTVPQWVLADTCIWIQAEADKPTAACLSELAAADRLAICGLIYAEILRGLRDEAVLAHRCRQLLSLRWLPVTEQVWEQTARLARQLDGAGTPVPLTDAHIAVLCQAARAAVWTTDKHFDRIPGLTRYPGPH